MTKIKGNKLTLRRSDGTEVEGHLEDCVLLPKDARQLEGKEPVEFEDEADPSRDPVVRSPGQMMEESRTDKETEIGPVPLHKKQFDGKLAKLGAGQFVAYCNSHPKLRKCRVGKVLTVSRQENLIIVHRYRPLADGRLRVRWLPAFTVGGNEVLGE